MTKAAHLIGMNSIIIEFLLFLLNFLSLKAVRIREWASRASTFKRISCRTTGNPSWAADHFAEAPQLNSHFS
jgi:hypothetical protein